MKKYNFGFTLIELLITIAIIGILVAISIFGLQGARESARDAKRKADLESIRSGLELYKSDCNVYPAGTSLPASLVGAGGPASCNGNVYLDPVPTDSNTSYIYKYNSDGVTYTLCAHLETGGTTAITCGSNTSCGSDICNIMVKSP